LARTVFRRAPGTRNAFFGAVDVGVRPLLTPFALRHARPSAESSSHTAEEIEALNRAAEDYFANHADRQHLVNKPFSEPAALSRRLIDLGVLIDGLRLAPGDTVLELGAGSCWVSHFLNKLGCRTVAVDVSQTALDIGRALFERDSTTDWTLRPEFSRYDGRTLPLADSTVDAIVLYDVFHHLPNPEDVLREMRRVLRADGIVGMSEPGRGHAASAPSRSESTSTGVLESELVIEDIADAARRCGFAASRVVIAGNAPIMEVDASGLRAFMGGRGFSRYWADLCASLDSHYYVLLFAGDPTPTTRRPKHLKAVIDEADDRTMLRVRRGESTLVHLAIRNVGDTRWLTAPNEAGWTRLGGHLYTRAPEQRLVDYDWFRHALPHPVAPDQRVSLSVQLPPIADAGAYVIAIDLVAEGLTWFADRESSALYLSCLVE
jgi:SAM-dependent methyltransferase